MLRLQSVIKGHSASTGRGGEGGGMTQGGGRKKRSSERAERAWRDGARQLRVGQRKESLEANHDSLSSRTQADLKGQSVCGDARNVCVHTRADKYKIERVCVKVCVSV